MEFTKHQKNTLSALKKCVIETVDIDHQADSLTNWSQEYDQISNGKFYGRTEKIESDHVHIFQEYTSNALHQDCQLWSNAIWFGIPFQDQKDSRINGQLISKDTIACHVGDQEFELVTPEDFSIYGVVLEETVLKSIAEKQGVDLLSSPLYKSLQFRVTPEQNLLLQALLKRFMIQSEKYVISEKIKQDFLVTAIINALPEELDGTSNLIPSYQHRKAVVDRVKAYLNECRNDVPVTITELCEIAYVSRRTLQYSFETILGCSPLKFLRTMRLNQVRRALKEAKEDQSIADIASYWGFWHAGQFSKDYKQLFGETPSETTHRSHR
ncbi:MAG: helix-turn-helix domain-containing protein [Thiotrichales bacterium]|nr:helix-turn-helix domain-containing protein [Thiotrichales bacterium]